MSLPNILPGVSAKLALRVTARRKAKRSHGEELLRHLVYVARHAYRLSVWQWAGRTAPVSGHSKNSMHYRKYPDGLGKAFDAYGPPGAMEAFGRWVDRYAPQVDEGIHNPGLSRKNGRSVPPSLWGSSTWSAHLNHVHIGNDGAPS